MPDISSKKTAKIDLNSVKTSMVSDQNLISAKKRGKEAIGKGMSRLVEWRKFQLCSSFQ